MSGLDRTGFNEPVHGVCDQLVGDPGHHMLMENGYGELWESHRRVPGMNPGTRCAVPTPARAYASTTLMEATWMISPGSACQVASNVISVRHSSACCASDA